MQQVVVPQFLDVEDKIIGPISVRQFIEMMVGALICFIFYKIFAFTWFVMFSLVVIMITVVIAFSKIQGQMFHLFLLSFIQTMRNPKLKIWRKYFDSAEAMRTISTRPIGSKAGLAVAVKPVTASRIAELSLLVDTGGVYNGEEIVNFN